MQSKGALYGFVYLEPALAFLRAIQKKHRRQIVGKINRLASNPYPPGVKKVEGVLDGEDQVYRLRQGKYRALYVVKDGNTIVILDIDHRKDVYR